MAMQYPRYLSLILALMFAALGGSVLALATDGTMVYMGELNLLAKPESDASFSSGPGPAEALGGSALAQATASNNSSLNMTNNTLINATSITDPATVGLAIQPRDLTSYSGKEVIDLTSYARDRANNNLAGYTNIMYPITGSRGTTTSTSGGGGGGGGCGCG